MAFPLFTRPAGPRLATLARHIPVDTTHPHEVVPYWNTVPTICRTVVLYPNQAISVKQASNKQAYHSPDDQFYCFTTSTSGVEMPYILSSMPFHINLQGRRLVNGHPINHQTRRSTCFTNQQDCHYIVIQHRSPSCFSYFLSRPTLLLCMGL